MIDSIEYRAVVQNALASMGDRPRDLGRAIANAADSREVDLPKLPLAWIFEYLASSSPDDPIEHAIGLAMRHWDRSEEASWVADTTAFTAERRSLIYQLLKTPNDLNELISKKLPRFSVGEVPAVVAEQHQHWYTEDRRSRRFYWTGYARYLSEKGWDSNAVAKLDHATDAVLTEISDPAREDIYQSKGLVVGYVQSGKTSHFTGVLAKAADAGYRLIIVLAGTLDILRAQTQRRIDKELIGRELLDSEYAHAPDWSEFISYGGRPSDLGYFDWERLTGSADDFKSVGRAIAALEFRRSDPLRAFNDPVNLRSAPVRLVVIKKNSHVIARLATDLGHNRVKSQLSYIPTLIVDDESDQASINTVDSTKKSADQKERTAINKAITNLLKILPRAQYIGYTATPFASVLVNPDDAEDLFPKDFIISLPRPDGYMGVSDFYDLDSTRDGFRSNKSAFVRDLLGDDEDAGNLPAAIDSFVLAGAIKLFRRKKAPKKFRFPHHTMLVHHSAYRSVHETQAHHVQAIWEERGYQTSQGLERLAKLFRGEFSPISDVQGVGLPMPKSFEELKPFIGECLVELNIGKTIRIVNGDNPDDTPNFDQAGIWAILIGGAKLSRGYTVEGLTTTYFRRVATASDTLMQMGRWFGFRPGYRDLVRLFIGRKEPISTKGVKTLDLYEAFGAMCLDEEEFRADIRKYLAEGLRPFEVPPLVPSHLKALAPTAKNKMYNAQLVFRNFGGTRIERTLAPTKELDAKVNTGLGIGLLTDAKLVEEAFSFRSEDRNGLISVNAFCGFVSTARMLKFLEAYKWETAESVIKQEIDYLKGTDGDPAIDRWLILVPRLSKVVVDWPRDKKAKIPPIAVRERTRIGRRFGVISDPADVRVANYLSGIDGVDLKKPSPNFAKYLQEKTAVMLFYLVKDRSEKFVSVVFTLQFPKNNVKKQLRWSVRVTSKEAGGELAVVDK